MRCIGTYVPCVVVCFRPVEGSAELCPNPMELLAAHSVKPRVLHVTVVYGVCAHALPALLAKVLVPRATAPLGFVRLVRERPSCTGARSGHPRRTRRRMAQGEDGAGRGRRKVRCVSRQQQSEERTSQRRAEKSRALGRAKREGRAGAQGTRSLYRLPI